MLARSQKVSKQLFGEILKSGRNFHSPNLSLRLLQSFEGRKVSFVVAKKVADSAVKRNLLKRRGYSIVRKLLPNLRENFSAVFFLKPGVGKLNFKGMKKEIEDILASAGLRVA
ncbi:MAG: ribonuclease P protein component [Candidatus Paceibacterota bacterium]|jgi:ribonuclease P protein component